MEDKVDPEAASTVRYERRYGHTADGRPWWTNVAYAGEVCLGGDCHWLTEAAANRALTVLRRGEMES